MNLIKQRDRNRKNALQQLSKDLGGFDISSKCPNCGASVKVDPKHFDTSCPFCNADLPQMHQVLRMSYDHVQTKKKDDIENRKLRIEESKERRAKISDYFLNGMLAIMGIGLLLMFIVMAVIIL